MSFGGAVSAMITSLKNNARKRKTLYDNKDFFKTKSTKKTFVTGKKATPKQLKEIRLRLQKENIRMVRRNLTITIIILVVIGILTTIIVKSLDSEIFRYGG